MTFIRPQVLQSTEPPDRTSDIEKALGQIRAREAQIAELRRAARQYLEHARDAANELESLRDWHRRLCRTRMVELTASLNGRNDGSHS